MRLIHFLVAVLMRLIHFLVAVLMRFSVIDRFRDHLSPLARRGFDALNVAVLMRFSVARRGFDALTVAVLMRFRRGFDALPSRF